MNTVIVTRHNATVLWLENHGITGEVISHVADSNQVSGKIVIGNIPLHLAAEAREVWAVEFPDMPPEKRGKELSIEDLDLYGRINRYRVIKVA